MPDEKGKLTTEEQAKAFDWLEKKVSKPCDACDSFDWILGDHLIASVHMNSNGILLGGEVLPCFCVICKNCGNTKYFNAILSGVYS